MHKKYEFFIDKENFDTDKSQLSVKQILVDFGKFNLSENILVLKDGNDLKELDNIEEILDMKNGMHFTVFSKKPNPVS
jgi:hypothetical protein